MGSSWLSPYQLIFMALWILVATAFGTGWGLKRKRGGDGEITFQYGVRNQGEEETPVPREPALVYRVGPNPSMGPPKPQGQPGHLTAKVPGRGEQGLGTQQKWRRGRKGTGGQGGLQPSIRPVSCSAPSFLSSTKGRTEVPLPSSPLS